MVSVNDRNSRYAQSPISNILMKKQLRKGRKKRTQSSRPQKQVHEGGEDLENIINSMTKDKSKTNLVSPTIHEDEKVDQKSNESYPVETTDFEGKNGLIP
mmetsp:Transcript_16034/g.24884  ORF Transcript_16034/g.24884 Transcript_16034/m.24884 type:complete len:100 (-) Transcript_16034:59-358(-)